MKRSQTIRQQWQDAGPNHVFIFAKLMQDPHLCIQVLEKFLDIEIDHIEYLETEKIVECGYEPKGIRLDVYVKDEWGTCYNVEMQRHDTTHLPRRSRYYQSLIDLGNLKRGQDYEQLPNAFIIFICNFDPFGKNAYVYSFENCDTNHSKGLLLNDGCKKIFFNTKGQDEIDPELRELLNFFDQNKPVKKAESPLVQELTDAFFAIKSNHEYEVSFMTQALREHDIRKEARAEALVEGTAIGLAEGRKELLHELLSNGILTPQQAEPYMHSTHDNPTMNSR